MEFNLATMKIFEPSTLPTSGDYMIREYVLNIEDHSILFAVSEINDTDQIERDLTNFPYLVKIDSGVFKVTEENFKSWKLSGRQRP